MKIQMLSLGIFATGVCLIASVSEACDKCRSKHGVQKQSEAAAGTNGPIVTVTEDLKAEFDLAIGIVEMREFPSSGSTVIAVPATAIISDANGDTSVLFSEVAATDASDQKFTLTKVKTGAISNGYIEIISGLLPGDTVILKNASRLEL